MEVLLRSQSIFALLALLALMGAGCAPRSDQASRAPLTERQRASLIARSRLPGSSVVGRSLAVSDQSSARAAEMNAATDSLFH